MQKKRVAIIGFGNIGKAVYDALQTASDLEFAGIVRANPSKRDGMPDSVKIVAAVEELGAVDAAILATPSRGISALAKEYIEKGIATVDSFDIHTDIWTLKETLAPIAKANNVASVISAGWDPGSDSVVRALLLACAPKGITDTNFGPGMSMGHTVAVKAIKGVKSALSMTIPAGTSIHKRMVYIELEPGADAATVTAAIKQDPYFVHDETKVTIVDDVDKLLDMGHGVHISRKGVSGSTQNQLFDFSMRINNPALTAQILVSCTRAALRQQPGCYTMIELPMIDLLEGEKEALIKALV